MSIGDRVEIVRKRAGMVLQKGQRGIITDFTRDGCLEVEMDRGGMYCLLPHDVELVIDGTLLYDYPDPEISKYRAAAG